MLCAFCFYTTVFMRMMFYAGGANFASSTKQGKSLHFDVCSCTFARVGIDGATKVRRTQSGDEAVLQVPKLHLTEAPAAVNLHLDFSGQSSAIDDLSTHRIPTGPVGPSLEKVNLDNVKPKDGLSWRVLAAEDAPALYLDAVPVTAAICPAQPTCLKSL